MEIKLTMIELLSILFSNTMYIEKQNNERLMLLNGGVNESKI